MTQIIKQLLIRDISTGISSFVCMIPKSQFNAVVKDDNIIFFQGSTSTENRFEIYNTTSNTWSTGVLNQKVDDATVISANNTIYVAGDKDNLQGPYFNQVWKLEF